MGQPRSFLKRFFDGGVTAIDRLIAEELVKPVYQPVVDLASKKAYAYECLARPDRDLFASPPAMLDAAVARGRIGELGRMLRRQAIAGCPDRKLFINTHPAEFDEPFLVLPDDPIYYHEEEVFLEVTESVPLSHFEQCYAMLRETRGKGIHLAVDDLGAGYSNLKYISDLEPEIVKLDRELVAGLKSGTRLFRLVKSIVNLCVDLGARVVAEGIEEPDELRTVIACGVHYGQGYLLARPAFPPPEPSWPDDVDPRI